MGETFGRYAVLGQLGRGAMGIVYLASDPVLNRQVAVKTVDLGVEDPEEREFLRTRLLRDARAAAVLKHPNIVAVYDVFEDAGRAYVVMEYVEGESLATRLKKNPLPDASAMLKVLGQMADALDYTHARGVVHRDIKPANVMIDLTGVAKIMDFGIARISDTRTSTPTGMVMGTVEYMAPEQILGEALDGRADQFALAVVAYQMMTGGTLFGPHTVATLTYKIVNEAPPPPSTRNAALPRGVDAVLVKALAKKPAERFATCSEFAGALEQAFSDAPTAPLAPPSVAAPAGRSRAALPAAAPDAPAGGSRAPLVAAGVAVLVLGSALAAVVWKPWSWTRPAPPAAAVATPPPAPSDVTSFPAVKVVEKPAPKAPKSEPPKSEPPKAVGEAKVERGKAVPALPKAAPPGIPKPVVAPEPTQEVEMSRLPPEPQTGAEPAPFVMAMRRGEQQIKAGDYPGAIQAFTRAVSLRPRAALAYYNRGSAYQRLEQFALAIEDYAQAQRLDPKLVQAYIGRGGCLVREHRDPEAFVEFQRALELQPDAVPALTARGNIYLRRKQYGPALTDYDRALNLNPRYAPAYLSRANAREAVGDLAGAAADRRSEAALRKP
jgi:Tfp pilus assembly protein PilF